MGAETSAGLVAAYDVVFDHLALTHDVRPSDAILCFGSRDPAVAVRAAELFHAGVAPLVVTTGGVAVPGGGTEAGAIARQLAAVGVPPERIVSEHRSRHTGDNVGHGLSALVLHHGPVRSLVTVAWPFAARRGVATVARQHPDIEVRSVPTRCRPGERTPCTPTTVRWAVEQAGRLVRYAAAGFIAPQPRPATVATAVDVLAAALWTAPRTSQRSSVHLLAERLVEAGQRVPDSPLEQEVGEPRVRRQHGTLEVGAEHAPVG